MVIQAGTTWLLGAIKDQLLPNNSEYNYIIRLLITGLNKLYVINGWWDMMLKHSFQSFPVVNSSLIFLIVTDKEILIIISTVKHLFIFGYKGRMVKGCTFLIFIHRMNILIQQEWKVHFIPTGMHQSILVGLELPISFWPERNASFYSGRNEMHHFIPAGMDWAISFWLEWAIPFQPKWTNRADIGLKVKNRQNVDKWWKHNWKYVSVFKLGHLLSIYTIIWRKK